MQPDHPQDTERCRSCGADLHSRHRRGCSLLIGDEDGLVMGADCTRPQGGGEQDTGELIVVELPRFEAEALVKIPLGSSVEQHEARVRARTRIRDLLYDHKGGDADAARTGSIRPPGTKGRHVTEPASEQSGAGSTQPFREPDEDLYREVEEPGSTQPQCDGSGRIPSGECRLHMSGPTCSNAACPPCRYPETSPCPGCPACKPQDNPPQEGPDASSEPESCVEERRWHLYQDGVGRGLTGPSLTQEEERAGGIYLVPESLAQAREEKQRLRADRAEGHLRVNGAERERVTELAEQDVARCQVETEEAEARADQAEAALADLRARLEDAGQERDAALSDRLHLARDLQAVRERAAGQFEQWADEADAIYDRAGSGYSKSYTVGLSGAYRRAADYLRSEQEDPA